MGIFTDIFLTPRDLAKPEGKPAYEEEDCPQCLGSGWYMDMHSLHPGGEQCVMCNATGKVRK